jgi:hypothetical protein
MAAVWHKLLHDSGRQVWAINKKVLTGPCLLKGCPGKPLVMQGQIDGDMLWYFPQDVQNTLHVNNGSVLAMEHGVGSCAKCRK